MTETEGLEALIQRLEESDRLSIREANRLERQAFDNALSGMLDDGESYGAAMGGLKILNQPEHDFQAELKSINNNLFAQIDILNEALDNWFAKGVAPPPYYAWRIAIILSKAKRLDDEKRFLAAWCRHFGDWKGRRYEDLAKRAEKKGASWFLAPTKLSRSGDEVEDRNPSLSERGSYVARSIGLAASASPPAETKQQSFFAKLLGFLRNRFGTTH